MKSDLTCPVEVVSVRIRQETPAQDGAEKTPLLCVIEFFNLSEKVIDSIQMNIICYDAQDARIGGRLVRATARGEGRARFSGAFAPDRVEGVARVDASVEKVWFQDGVVWRREERNVREYTPNALPEGRELDRLRAVAGPDAAGYAREDDIVWMCVCGRANPTSDDRCRRCQREREAVLRDYSFSAIDSTVGRRERELERQTMDTLRRSSEETARQMTEQQRRAKKRRRRVTAVVVLLAVVAVALAALRWGMPAAACLWAQRELEGGQAADAKALFEWVDGYWPGFMDADLRAQDAERAIIEGLMSVGTDETLAQAAERAAALETEDAPQLYEQAVLARASLAETAGDYAQAELLLGQLGSSETANARRLSLCYRIALEAEKATDYATAIERYAALGDYEDAAQRREECLLLYGRQLMRAGRFAEAEAQLLLVSGRSEVLALIRQCRYAQGVEAQEAGRYAEAAELLESLGVYEDAETRARQCRYTLGMDALEAGDLETAAEQLRLAESYEDAKERFADVALTLGSAAMTAGDYARAAQWFSQLDQQGEGGELWREAVYAYAQALEAQGRAQDAVRQYALLGDYEEALERLRAIEYQLALEEMESDPEGALARFEGLGDYKDAAAQARACRYALAEQSHAEGDLRAAMERFEALGDYEDSEAQALRSRYALAGELLSAQRYDEAAVLYEGCGAYLDAEDRAMRARYDAAAALEEDGQYREAARAFAALGSYEDAKLRTERCEDAWLGDAYASARLDMELGDYESVMEDLEDVWQEELPGRYAQIPELMEQACLSRAKELIAQRRPLDALPVLERIPDSANAQKLLDAYVYQIIGRWKDTRGREYVFRRDGSCSIDGQEGYFSGSDYDIAVGDAPYPTQAAYGVISLKKGVLTLKEVQSGSTLRLTYLGEPTERAQEPQEAADGTSAEAAQDENGASADAQE
ncbi:MAG: soluble NSF attachment family protein [Clostridiales bacterium]|nr:soluble NSF attachment family protein [Clostridiales bacterium]